MRSHSLAPERNSDSNSTTNYRDEFKSLSQQFAQLLSSADVDIKPFQSTDTPWFCRSNQEQQAQILSKLQSLITVYQATIANGHSLRNSKMLLWSALKQLRFTCKSDLLNLIEADDIIEIYDSSHIQLFCNMTFYDYCSYTVEDLFCRPWQELFSRDNPNAIKQILEVGLGMLTGKITDTTNMSHVDQQIVRETTSAFKFEYKMDIEYFSPLFQEGSKTPTAIIAIEKAQILNSQFVDKNKSQLLTAFEQSSVLN